VTELRKICVVLILASLPITLHASVQLRSSKSLLAKKSNGLTVKANGALLLNGESIERAHLELALREVPESSPQVLYIYASADVAPEAVLEVMDLCSRFDHVKTRLKYSRDFSVES